MSTNENTNAAPMLSADDWSEIFAALDARAISVESGDYGEEHHSKPSDVWAAQLRSIMERIGYNGEAAHAQAVERPMLNKRELATVLAALRNFQATTTDADGEEFIPQDLRGHFRAEGDGFAQIDPLSNGEIDALCERLNCAEPAQLPDPLRIPPALS